MGDKSKIEWTDATWNPVTGCKKVSPGCDHCYAETFAERWRGTQGHYFESGFDLTLRPERLEEPLKWRKPRRIFVNSMSDLFHPDVPEDFIAQVWTVMEKTPQHTYQILTKRHARMRSIVRRIAWRTPTGEERTQGVRGSVAYVQRDEILNDHLGTPRVLPNVWLGVSVETQQWADTRIPALLDTPAAVRKDSDGTPYCGTPSVLDWVVAGGESGPGARPPHPDWFRQLRDQCEGRAAFLFKQWGAWKPRPIYSTDDRHHVVMPDGRDRGTPWPGWGIDQPDAVVMERVGKGAAGRELDGRTWDEYPVVVR
ncbi:phage Gp37/Gp68 family protein [Microbispora sp. RL4-1S]|uniref:Phage Gp37/Gp68 family protein n=1 Tax=Microbispora oryzae TaxID=2806554 RepID=A0A940WPD4_9ACTN|nr:phage Gp37/Gp68 family protein [Microbispora oryzae]MBP2704454.1 phage Gp37/Gp68 family protein [Microbispora oryzae]